MVIQSDNKIKIIYEVGEEMKAASASAVLEAEGYKISHTIEANKENIGLYLLVFTDTQKA